jgi:hypothetical protein
VDRDRLPALVALGEIVALEHARDGVPGRELDQPAAVIDAHPARVEIHARPRRVEDLEDLRLVGARIRLDFLGRERRSRRVAPGRVADQAGEVADQENDVVAEALEAPPCG